MHDLIIIGAGPGGYEAAIRARQNNLSVLLFESRDVGGTCLNRGCIPTKALLHAAQVVDSSKEAEAWGITMEPQLDIAKLYSKKEEIVSSLRQGVETLLSQNGVEVIYEKAVYMGNATVKAGENTYQAKNVLLATGSKPLILPIPGLHDNPLVLTSDDFLASKPDYQTIAILGGGVIGVELASFCLSMGIQVLVIEAMPRILPLLDREISQSLSMNMKRKGAQIFTNSKLERVENADGKVHLFIEGKEEPLIADRMLKAVGRTANLEGLFDENTEKPQIERGRIVTQNYYQTSLPNLYAVGDIIHGPQLAHAASAQGLFVADYLAGKEEGTKAANIPSCIYTRPEVATVGLTEDEAKEQGIKTVSSKYIMTGNGRTVIAGSGRGFIKIVAQEGDETIIGAHLMCENASDIVSEFTLAIANKLTVSQMLKPVRPHPTFSEGVTEALESLHGRAIHIAPPRKKQ